MRCPSTLSRLGRLSRALHIDISGVGAIEFAIVLPVMVTLLLGGFALSQGAAALRKTTATTRTVTDLVARTGGTGSLSAADMSKILNASTQVMTPFSTSTLKIVVSQIQAPASCLLQGSVSWSATLNGTALATGSKVTLPTGVCQPNTYIIRTDVTYGYTPPVGNAITGTFNFTDSLYMTPRQVASINYTGN